MAAESQDLRLNLRVKFSQKNFPLKLTLFPPLNESTINGETESLSGKRSERDDDQSEEDGHNSLKKLRMTKEQTALLEESFKENNTLNPKQNKALAKQLNLRLRQVEVWFQNRRASEIKERIKKTKDEKKAEQMAKTQKTQSKGGMPKTAKGPKLGSGGGKR